MASPDSESRVTLRDLARQLNVSHTTVSRALKNDPRISEAVRKRVQSAALQMGYRADPMLAALAHYRLGRARKPVSAGLAWVNCWPEPKKLRTFKEFDLYWKGASAEAERAGYRLEEFDCPKDLSPKRLEQILLARNIRGILLTPAWSTDKPDWGNFKWDSFSVVRFGYSLATPIAHVVTSDQLQEGVLAFNSMWERGYRRIGLVTHRIAGTQIVRFSAGYLYAQLKVPRTSQLAPFTVGENFSDAEYDRFASWLKTAKPDALLTDLRNLPELLTRAGYRVPEDIGLAALSVLDGCADAGINQHSEEVGVAAIQLLISLIHHHQTGIPSIPRETLITGEWVDGKSLPPKRKG